VSAAFLPVDVSAALVVLNHTLKPSDMSLAVVRVVGRRLVDALKDCPGRQRPDARRAVAHAIERLVEDNQMVTASLQKLADAVRSEGAPAGTTRRRCVHCGRSEPEHIFDPTCSAPGPGLVYCDWGPAP
jgi:hypothetical protein